MQIPLRSLRELLPPERVDEEILYEIKESDVYQLQLTPTDQFEIVQHIELLDLPIHVTEYRLREYVNQDGETFLPHVPRLRNQPIFGPRMLAMVGWLKSRAHCSYTTIEAWMEDISSGSGVAWLSVEAVQRRWTIGCGYLQQKGNLLPRASAEVVCITRQRVREEVRPNK